jgi:hypothetical protein
MDGEARLAAPDLKRCFRCERELPADEFYRHPRMTDGHLGKCKSCTKRDVRANYRRNHTHFQQYERMRLRSPERRRYKRAQEVAHRLRHPDRAQARWALNNAVRDGRLLRKPCEVCGARAEAHHEDYSKPLDVRWLCLAHHREHHRAQAN